MLSFLESFHPADMSTWSHKEICMQHKALCLSTQGFDINLAETYFPGPLPAGVLSGDNRDNRLRSGLLSDKADGGTDTTCI